MFDISPHRELLFENRSSMVGHRLINLIKIQAKILQVFVLKVIELATREFVKSLSSRYFQGVMTKMLRLARLHRKRDTMNHSLLQAGTCSFSL